ncbi:MAG: hypothetical protein Q8Q85_06065 [Gemmatimonadales bacterium]|nr:hypothetical protein [Gemmatimonadales bacterium]
MSTERQAAAFGTNRFLATHAVFRLEDLRAAMGEPSAASLARRGRGAGRVLRASYAAGSAVEGLARCSGGPFDWLLGLVGVTRLQRRKIGAGT